MTRIIFKHLYLTPFLLISLLSCEEQSYKFQLVNSTNYTLDSVHISNMNKSIVTVPPMGSSEVVELKFNHNIGDFFSERMVSLYVTTYSDSTQTFTNQYGSIFSFEKFNKGQINLIYIELNETPHFETSIFEFKTEYDHINTN